MTKPLKCSLRESIYHIYIFIIIIVYIFIVLCNIQGTVYSVFIYLTPFNLEFLCLIASNRFGWC